MQCCESGDVGTDAVFVGIHQIVGMGSGGSVGSSPHSTGTKSTRQLLGSTGARVSSSRAMADSVTVLSRSARTSEAGLSWAIRVAAYCDGSVPTERAVLPLIHRCGAGEVGRFP